MLRMRLKSSAQQVRIWVVISLLAAVVVGFLTIATIGVRYEDGHAEFVRGQVDEALKNGKVLDQNDIRRIASSFPRRTEPYELFSWRYFSTAFRQASFLMAGLVLLIGIIAKVSGAECVGFGLFFVLLALYFSASPVTYVAVIVATVVAWVIVKTFRAEEDRR